MISEKVVKTVEEQIRMFKIVASRITGHASRSTHEEIFEMTKAALITGINGQDGAYLAKFLLDKSYEVFGTYRRLSTKNFWRLQYLEIFESVNLIPADLVDAGSMVEAVKISEPDEIL